MTTPFPIQEVAAQLAEQRRHWRDSHQRSQEPGGREFPSRDALAQTLGLLKGVLFPLRLGPPEARALQVVQPLVRASRRTTMSSMRNSRM